MTIPERPQFPALSPHDAAQPQLVAQVVGLAMIGKTNNVIDVEVPVGPATSLMIIDQRITAMSWVSCMTQRTFVTSVSDGSAVISWTGTNPPFLRVLVVG